MRNNKFCAIIIPLMLITGTLFASPVVSSLTSSIILRSSGQIVSPNVTAESGSAADIQAAVDWIVARGGIGNVSIPEGIFNFVEVGEPWMTVNIPSGVNLFGASTERNADGQVVEWKTVLVMPWDVPGDWASVPTWFKISGSNDPNKPSRFSDIKLVGYRSIDASSVTLHRGIVIENVVDFRVDHVSLEHMAGGGIRVGGLECNGVIDHNRIYNLYGFDDLANYVNGNIGYGVHVSRSYYSEGYEPLMEVLGQYTDHSVYIEDNYFSRWRHNVASGHGAHYVFRYNVIDLDMGHFSLDVHGLRDSGENRWGTRAAEIYENTLTNCLSEFISRAIFQNGGGSGVWFNNYIDTSYYPWGIALYPEDYIPSDTWHLKDFYLWSSLGTWSDSRNNGVPDGFTEDRNVYADWTRSAGTLGDPNYPNTDPSWTIAGYKPYTYPHPLTTG